jgi:glycosyltransferase involved in cell wall biosynthesis
MHEMPTYTHLSLWEKFWFVVYEALVLRRADRIIVPSTELRDFFANTYRVRPEKLRIVKNGVETEVLKPAKSDPLLRQTLGVPEEATVVVFTNPRLADFPSNELALRMLFRVIPEVERRLPSVWFVILGGGPELPGPSDRIIYTGFVKDLAAYLNLGDICIATYPPEAVCGGTRNKICEYMACGKPIVATPEAMRGFDDAVAGEHFLLAEDENECVVRLEECVRFPDMARRLGQNARMLSEKYDWSRSAAQIKEVFEELAETRDP